MIPGTVTLSPGPYLRKGKVGTCQRRIFIFGTLDYFKFGALLEVLGQLMSYKLAPHVLVTSTEQALPIHKHISYFILNSLDIRNKDSRNETN